MIEIPHIDGKKFAVFGLGTTGLSVCEALIASGAEVFSWDENAVAREKTAKTKYASEHPKEWPWGELSALVLSPGVPLTHPKPHVIVRKAQQENVEIIGDIELFSRAINALPVDERPRIVGVTGSNGKSTTTALIRYILKETGHEVYMGGNIGDPLLGMPAPNSGVTYVLELSSYQLDLTTSFKPNTSILINISPDHLERHGGIEGYVEAKKRIFRNQTEKDIAIVGVDDANSQMICASLAASSPIDVTPISSEGALGRGVFALEGRLFYSLDEKNGEAGSIATVPSLCGAHNWQNATAALGAAIAEGIEPNVACSAMQRFDGLPHRMEVVATKNGVTFVNDSKATNAEAAGRAIDSFENIFWIAGGRIKEGGIENLKSNLSAVRGAYLIGEAAPIIESQLAGATPVYRCGDLKSAVLRAARDAEHSGLDSAVVLLSPACASFDQFSNFELRGDAFKSAVSDLVQKNGAAA